jgi:hypothetical protein
MHGHLERIEMQPEGAGLYLAKGLQLARDGVAIRDRTVVVLMFGHRNLSILTFEKGSTPQETNSTSQGPGFVEYLKQCATELPGVAPDDPALLEAVLQNHETFHVPGRQEALDLTKPVSMPASFIWTGFNSSWWNGCLRQTWIDCRWGCHLHDSRRTQAVL